MNVEYSRRTIADLRKISTEGRAFGEATALAVEARLRHIIARIAKHPEEKIDAPVSLGVAVRTPVIS